MTRLITAKYQLKSALAAGGIVRIRLTSKTMIQAAKELVADGEAVLAPMASETPRSAEMRIERPAR